MADSLLLSLLRSRNERIARWKEREAQASSALTQLKDDIVNTGRSGLYLLAKVLDAPGNLVRTTLRAAIDPFQGRWPRMPSLTDTFSGRDLLRQLGIASENDTWGNYLAGLGVDIALDPLTYLTGGLNKAGTAVAKQVGKTGYKAAMKDVMRTVGSDVLEKGLRESPLARWLISESAIERGMVPHRTLGHLLTPSDLVRSAETVEATDDLARTMFQSGDLLGVHKPALPNYRSAMEAGEELLPQNAAAALGDSAVEQEIRKLSRASALRKLISEQPELASQTLRPHELGLGFFGWRRRDLPLGRWELPVAALRDRAAFEIAQLPGIRGLRRLFVPSALGAKSSIVQSLGHADMAARDAAAAGTMEWASQLARELESIGYRYPREPVKELKKAIALRMAAEGVDNELLANIAESIRRSVFQPRAEVFARRLETRLSPEQLESLRQVLGIPQEEKLSDFFYKALTDTTYDLNALFSALPKTDKFKPGIFRNAFRRSLEKGQAIFNQKLKNLESTPAWATLRESLSELERLDPRLLDIFKRYRERLLPQIAARSHEMGINLGVLANAGDDIAEAAYWPRYAPADFAMVQEIVHSPVTQAIDPSRLGRKAILSDLPGGTGTLMAILSDPRVVAMAKEKAITPLRDYLKTAYSDILGTSHYEHLAKWLASRGENVLEAGFFARDPFIDLLSRVEKFNRLKANADLLRDVLAQPRVLLELEGQLPFPEFISEKMKPVSKTPKTFYRLGDLLNQLGYSRSAISRILTSPEYADNFYRWHQELVDQLLEMDPRMTPEKASETAIEAIIKRMADTPVDPTVAKDLVRRVSAPKAPSMLQPLQNLAESYTNIFRAHATVGRPAFHIGNLLSGVAQSFATIPDPKKTALVTRDVFRLISGDKKAIDPARYPQLARLFTETRGTAPRSAEELSDFLMELARNYEVAGRAGMDVAYHLPEETLQVKPLIDYMREITPASAEVLGGGRNPLRRAITGLLYATEDDVSKIAPGWANDPGLLIQNPEFRKELWERGVKENLRKFFRTRGAIPLREQLLPYLERVPANLPWYRRLPLEVYNRARAAYRAWRDDELIPARVLAETETPFLRFGEKISGKIEATNRLIPFLRLIEEGYSPLAAAEETLRQQVSYLPRHYTNFEKWLASWPIPFYKFNRGMAKYLATELTQRPYGPYGQMLRMYARGMEANPFVPDYLQDTIGFALTDPNADPQLYVTGLGLMPESAAAIVSLSPSELTRNILSNASPIIRGPIEFATGHSLWQLDRGEPRSLREIKPLTRSLLENLSHHTPRWIDRILMNVISPVVELSEPVLANSPVSPYLAMLRRVTDPDLPLWARAAAPLTRIRVLALPRQVTDNVLRDRIEEYLTSPRIGGRIFERAYVPENRLQQMPAHLAEKAKAAENLLNVLSARAKAIRGGREVIDIRSDPLPDDYYTTNLLEEFKRRRLAALRAKLRNRR